MNTSPPFEPVSDTESSGEETKNSPAEECDEFGRYEILSELIGTLKFEREMLFVNALKEFKSDIASIQKKSGYKILFEEMCCKTSQSGKPSFANLVKYYDEIIFPQISHGMETRAD